MQTGKGGRLGDVLVLGMGKTGVDVALYLASLGEARVSSVTLYGGLSSAPGEAASRLEATGVRVVLGSEDVRGSYDLAVVSPGISELSDFFRAAREHSRELIGEPELAWRESPGRWVAITGTNGKTTTTSLSCAILREAGLAARTVGNIGTLATSQVAGRAEGEWFVAELSSFQLATSVGLHPRVAVLLNVTPDHLEWHGSLEAYAAAKERVFANLVPGDLAVVGVGDGWCRAIADRLDARGLRVLRLDARRDAGTPCAAFVRDGRMVVRLDGVEHDVCATADFALRGEHNLQNGLAASALALELGVADDVVARTLASFQALEHRIEPCGEVGGVSFVNDSKATNTDSVEKALTAFEPGRVVLMLGGHDKGTDLRSLAEAVARDCRAAVCFGEAGERIARSVEAARDRQASPVRVVRAPHLREAFDAAVAEAREGDAVLLSPACSSFDEFSNMAERGRLFKSLVAALADEGRR